MALCARTGPGTVELWYPADSSALARGTLTLLKGSLLDLAQLLPGLILSGTHSSAWKIYKVIKTSSSAIFGSILSAGF